MHHLVFVFGTLKRGFPNHHLIAQQPLLGDFETAHPYPLYLVSERYSPWMMDQAGEGMKVRGQVFKVDEQCLAALDELERIHARDGYRRQEIKVSSQQGSVKLTVYAYLKPEHQLNTKAIRCGPITEYLLEHASLYRSRKIRS
jgi:gamma-glutamylaminecyclotransferase